MTKAAPRKPAPRRAKTPPPFECTALLLQGGGALGSYQAGVYQALAEANVEPTWVAGISIGAVNSALIAGNPAETRVARLREFWETISASPVGVPTLSAIKTIDDEARRWINGARAMGTLAFGAPAFFAPRVPSPAFWPFVKPDAVSHYDVGPLKATLERLVDFDRINAEGGMRFSVGAVNVRNGNFTYFDSTTHRIGAAHVIASGSLPPGFPATEIEGEYYWDGGLVSNTPLQWVLDNRPRRDTLAFQVDLWSAEGAIPRNLLEDDVRQKEIRFSSRTRAATDQYKKAQKLRIAVANLIGRLPESLRDDPDVRTLQAEADDKICNIVHLIYQAKPYEGVAKDFEFSRRTMEEHWAAGYDDALRALAHPEVLQRPSKLEGVRTFDFRRHGKRQ
jgi:NTE family protein